MEWAPERGPGTAAYHKVDFAGPLVSVTYGAAVGTMKGVVNAYRLFFKDGSIFEITDADSQRSLG
jgi:hypothetical protein